MTRTLAGLILLAVAVAAIAASDRAKPMIVEAHSSGQWDFNNADWQYPTENPDLLFAPRPTGPQNHLHRRLTSERKA